ncbi:transposase, partial [uncultured Arthrobacter sp.]|uniref:transposase n=1 Tax=uncultured Arthrobacter sp. TaxID=114050 RepID=UPI002615D3E7
GLKVTALVAGMVAGADCIDDMGVLRHGGTGKLFTGTYAPSTLGSFLRRFTFGHVRQLEAAASRWLPLLAAATPLASGIDDLALVDIDDTIKEVYGYKKQGSGYGYSGVRGLNAFIGTVTTGNAAPFIAAARLRKGAANSARGAGKFVSDLLANVARLRSKDAAGMVLLRSDSAFYAHAVATAAARAGAKVSLTVRMDPAV